MNCTCKKPLRSYGSTCGKCGNDIAKDKAERPSDAAACSRDWWVVDRNADDAKINGPHGSAETAGSVRHALELNASDEQNERWNLCLKRIPENSEL